MAIEDDTTLQAEQPPHQSGFPPDADTSLRLLAENAIRSLGGSAGMILLWDQKTAISTRLGDSGLAPDESDDLSALLELALPEMLAPGGQDSDQSVRIWPDQGWQVGDDGRDAHMDTPRGPLHLALFPVRSSSIDSGSAPDDEEHSSESASNGPLMGLLCLFHPDGAINLHDAFPGVLDLVAGQVELVLVNARLLNNVVREARLLDTVLQHTSEGLVILDTAGRVLGCNPAFERLTGWASSALWGRLLTAPLDIRCMRWQNIDAEEEPWDARDAIASAIGAEDDTTSAPPRVHELVLTAHNGAQIYTEASVSPIRPAGDGVEGAVVSFRDVTAEREAEELQATFLSVISHELQTPLAVIRGYAELLSDSGAKMKPAKMREKLDIVAEESTRLSNMVTKLLDASRIQAGGLELSREPVDIGQLVRRVVQKMDPLTEGHHFVVGIADDLPPVLADYDRIEQVLINLAENAIKYSPGGGRITITADHTSEDVIVRVSDEGIGVPQAERRRIFSRFSRLNSRVVRQMKGVGLGLYISRAIILAHGGRIWVDSAPGGGAEFSFSLPRQYKAPLPVLFGRG